MYFCIPHACLVPEEVVRSLGNVVMDGRESLCRCQELNLGLLPKFSLTDEPYSHQRYVCVLDTSPFQEL